MKYRWFLKAILLIGLWGCCFQTVILGSEEDISSVEQFFQKGISQMKTNQLNEAIDSFHKALDLLHVSDIRRANILDNLGLAYQYNGDLERATQLFQDASRLNQKLPLPYLHLCAAYRLKKDEAQAIVECSKALEIKPDLFTVHEEMAKVYSIMGRKRGYNRELISREIYHLMKTLQSFPDYVKVNPVAENELKYLLQLDQDASAAEVKAKGKEVRILHRDIKERAENRQLKPEDLFVQKIDLPDDGISKADKQSMLELAKKRMASEKSQETLPEKNPV
ncbi:MAG: hypothetical protein A3G33_05165 [Omnitrophica bacterium RIFCSPLOWO2_12_FULL_44_17]|uniref:Uncharacterized protein n=1 Tax=Candidatus Danuiimicrobium aquiferis TaxID=1801832 RepID=A0A1G1KX72_9BACT|nr:MAG: hypothetical protein A3B72_01535 [Omnitrophica bacterium RIFCSPHIGHO2_02_FULL_45_28]OGW90979.1 MAG: hypothetical protein A3E74_01755 [Omnitrophica bacterium RIFCSPHIGHO2_12_FULL_44_12]OGW97546.1 MAG: hypothetical protein A3G33_05165 [Omnitrophica bacterium RIFCSPLOWO2_12_FULL_44_17]OGX02098.1 MAG: hypothetical protein A3J12_06455 [Omnitrophica bacterium RIFCSPLOWO2_02_FULL_44_11]